MVKRLRKSIKKPSKAASRRIIAVAVVVAMLVGYTTAFITTEYDGESTTIYVPATTNQAEVDSVLTGVAGSAGHRAALLLRLSRRNASTFRGAYALPHGASTLNIFLTIVRHHQTPVRLTFNNLRTLDQLAERVAATLDITKEQFLSATDSLLADVDAPRRPGRFIPDTYEFYWTASPVKVVTTLVDQYSAFWNADRVALAEAKGLTPDQVVVIASIAEEETNDQSERATVGQLYINRLRRNMPLQADPTVKFAVGDFSLRRITAAQTAVDSPYNTYKYAGLPPGPIRIPSAATIDGILSAPANNYLYMCAKEDFSGRHNFTSDYATHMANAARYHKALNAKNIN